MAATGENPAELSALRRKVTFTFGTTFLVFCTDRVVQVGFLAILARLLDPAQFGTAAAGLMVVSITTQLSQLGLGPTLIQHPGLDQRGISVARSITFATATACFAACLLGAPLAGMWFRSPEVMEAVRVLAVLCLINGLALVPHSLLIRRLRARDVSISDLLSGIIGSGLVAIPLALAGFGYWSLVWGYVATALAKCISMLVLDGWGQKLAFDLDLARKLLFKGAGFSLTLFLHRIGLESDRLIIGRFLSTADLGLYSRANGLMALPSTFYGAVADRVIFPAFAQIQEDQTRMARAYSHACSLTAVIGIPLTVFLIFAGPDIIMVILGRGWVEAIAPFKILCLAIYLRFSDRVSATLLRGAGKPYLMARLQTVSAVVTIAGSLFACRYGISGVASAVVVGAVVSYLLLTRAAAKVTSLSLGDYLKSQAHGLAAGLLIAGVLAPLSWAAGQWGWPPIGALAAMAVAAAVAATIGLIATPKVFLGSAGVALVDSARHTLRRQLRRRRGEDAGGA